MFSLGECLQALVTAKLIKHDSIDTALFADTCRGHSIDSACTTIEVALISNVHLLLKLFEACDLSIRHPSTRVPGATT